MKIVVSTADGKPLPPDAEVAIAAVDEGLLELAPNRSWDELEAMMGRRGYGIQNATAQGQVVGKRHYGLKALPQGGAFVVSGTAIHGTTPIRIPASSIVVSPPSRHHIRSAEWLAGLGCYH